MNSICELLGQTILAEVNEKRHGLDGYIHSLHDLTVRMRYERLNFAHAVPFMFLRNPLTEDGIGFITNNAGTFPLNAAFLEALEAHHITPAMWKLAKQIETGRNSFAHPLCASHQFELIAEAYTKAHALDPAAAQLCIDIAKAVRETFDQDGSFWAEP
jgi:hypothetical protein